jgi:flagella basal body P-ring formation protein FlgA
MKHSLQSIRVLISGFIIFSTITASIAMTRNELRRTVTTDKETLSLADLIDGENIPTTPLFRAPAPGENGTIKVDRIMNAARKVSLDIAENGGIDEILITRQSRRVTTHDVESAVQSELARNLGNQKFEFVLEHSDQPLDRDIESTALKPLEIRNLKRDPESGFFQALAIVGDSLILQKAPLVIKGRLTPLYPVYIALRDVERGDVIGDADFREELRPVSATDIANPPQPVLPRGMVSKRSIKAGEPIPPADLTVEIQVEKNANVLVRYERAGLTISMRGKALQSGAMGEVISVINPQSKRSIEALVTGKGKVLVKPENAANFAAVTN